MNRAVALLFGVGLLISLLVWSGLRTAPGAHAEEPVSSSESALSPAAVPEQMIPSVPDVSQGDRNHSSGENRDAILPEQEGLGQVQESPTPDVLCIHVRCVRPDGQSVPRSSLDISKLDGVLLQERVETDVSGMLEIKVQDFDIGLIIAAKHDGQGLASGQRLLVPGELQAYRCGTGVLELVLLPQVSVHGVVMTTAGKAIADATVELAPSGILLGGASASPVDPVKSDERGRFAFMVDGVSASWKLRATTEVASSRWRTLQLPVEAGEEQLLLVSSARYLVEGVLLAPPGCDLSTGSVQLVPDEPGLLHLTAACSADGTFQFELERPTGFRLAARADGVLSRQPVAGEVNDASPSAMIQLPLEAASFIAGHVRGGDGEPLPGIGLTAFAIESLGQGDWCTDLDFTPVASPGLVITSDSGSFRFDGLHADYVYRVDYRPDPNRMDYRLSRHGVRPGTTDLEIIIDADDLEGGSLRGNVRYEGVEPMPSELFVSLGEWREDYESWVGGPPPTVAIDDGHYRVDRLVIGRKYVAEIHLPGVRCAPIWLGPWVATAEPKTVDLLFGRDGGVRVTLTKPSGDPASGWFIDAQPEGGQQPTRLSFSVDDNGVALVKPLAEGIYVLHARHGDTRLGPFRVGVVGGETIQMSVTVQ